MLPIAILPMAGILLGVGGAFTSPALIETYNLTYFAAGYSFKLCFSIII